MPPSERLDPPYRVIAAEIGARIARGELRPGDRVPSIRAIARDWGVAVATATKVTAALREEGLVETTVGSGTVVTARSGASLERRPGSEEQEMLRTRIVRAAIDMADADGLHTLSMRRLANRLDLGPMSLYRHVTGKDDLLTQMADLVFGDCALPEHGPRGWRAKLEHVAREHWRLCSRHPWLPQVVSFTRPNLVPHMMDHTEWTLRALDELELPMDVRLQEALTLHGLVVTVALSNAREAAAERRSGLSLSRWSRMQRARRREVLTSTRYPLLSAVSEDAAPDLETLFEYGLARHLDGLAVMTTALPESAQG